MSKKNSWLHKPLEKEKNRINRILIGLALALFLVFIVMGAISIIAINSQVSNPPYNNATNTTDNILTEAGGYRYIITPLLQVTINSTIISGFGLATAVSTYISKNLIFFKRKKWIRKLSFIEKEKIKINFTNIELLTEKGIIKIKKKLSIGKKYRIEMPKTKNFEEMKKYGLKEEKDIYSAAGSEEEIVNLLWITTSSLV